MAIQQVLTLNWTRSSDQIANNVTVGSADDGEANVDVGLTALQSNKNVLLALDVSALKLLYISSDVGVTIKTNSSGSPDDTLTLTANKPLVWYSGGGITNPLGTDVTSVYITNAANSVGTVKIRTLQDSTP